MKRDLVAIEDVDEAAGMLIGMVVSAPQRAAIYGRAPLPSRKELALENTGPSHELFIPSLPPAELQT